jgi:hypothetical protein
MEMETEIQRAGERIKGDGTMYYGIAVRFGDGVFVMEFLQRSLAISVFRGDEGHLNTIEQFFINLSSISYS